MTITNAVKVQNLSINYKGNTALHDVNLIIPNQTRTAIVGPNGAGKSTLVKGILGIEKLASGTVEILNETEHLNKIISQKIAYIPQSSQVNWQFPATVDEIVLMGRYPHIAHMLKKPSKLDKDIASHALEQMKLSDLKNRQITELSGGQRQRVFIARALAQQAELYILDEPLAGIDIQTEHIIMDTLKDFQKEGKTSIVIHHDLHTVSTYYDYVVWVNKTIVHSGPVETAFNDEWYFKTYKNVQSNQQFINFTNKGRD
ncbi:ATP-binding cassette domain-containing protein [Granulicatella sp. zg-ZJ]|uniref:metal ABC transporter ATP-binding protein n=1 Tax=unclassified Granulicatella TaxID=2630493 RepID=UPI0013C238B4|nr:MULTISPECIES: metal ABC transporter ATP-binding protein [unclassified Granulicatella]MBS4750097.1 metal ABC transporter ATP-binding protein [Carnobacteriaceae bacterium zg-ZUI78]NEW63103.1 ATP-binding cassette domain-containing protein [Granulicatella sp. zg-ZJ]NEW66604.1 ATP-binding cassette domain-containing protein [Granulicatella sp. zg-84]QMI86255.1 metal ABC transporter ATP-binding protein [Carnobacteriaceae bacterium zg-84]